MPLININAPGPIVRNVIEEHRRFGKHTTDNIARINNKFAIVEFEAEHGVETGVDNPFGDRGAPSGFQVINAVLSDGTPAVGVSSWSMRTARLTEDNQLGMTLQFAMPVGEQIELVRTTDTSNYTTGNTGSVSWSGILTVNSSIGDALSWSSGADTRITIGEAGNYLIKCHAVWAANATGVRGTYLYLDGTRIDSAEYSAAPAATFSQPQLVRPLTLSAGQYLEMYVRQDSGGNLAMQGEGSLTSYTNAAGRASFSATRLRNDEAYTATVTAIFYAP